MSKYADLDSPRRILLGPGPSMVSPRVLRAMAQPLVGHAVSFRRSVCAADLSAGFQAVSDL
jgi:aspartate aminotransferase-like enzyme